MLLQSENSDEQRYINVIAKWKFRWTAYQELCNEEWIRTVLGLDYLVYLGSHWTARPCIGQKPRVVVSLVGWSVGVPYQNPKCREVPSMSWHVVKYHPWRESDVTHHVKYVVNKAFRTTALINWHSGLFTFFSQQFQPIHRKHDDIMTWMRMTVYPIWKFKTSNESKFHNCNKTGPKDTSLQRNQTSDLSCLIHSPPLPITAPTAYNEFHSMLKLYTHTLTMVLQSTFQNNGQIQIQE